MRINILLPIVKQIIISNFKDNVKGQHGTLNHKAPFNVWLEFELH